MTPRPCFCCGFASPIVVHIHDSITPFSVECPSCGARGPFCSERAEAICAWNEVPRLSKLDKLEILAEELKTEIEILAKGLRRNRGEHD